MLRPLASPAVLRRILRSTFSIAAASAVLLPSLTARAEDVGSLLEALDENVVTGASRSAERAEDAPATSTTITAEQLRRFGIVRLEDALNYLSLGMFAHERMSTAEVGARGMAISRDSNSHVLVLLDGMVMNEQGGGAVFLHDIPLDLVDHIEVILGPGSVLYGSQAMLGVINVVTKAPNDYPALHAGARFGVSPPLDSNGDIRAPDGFGSLGTDTHYSVGTGQRHRILGQDVGVLLALDYTDFRGPDFSFHRQPSTYDFGPHAEPGTWGGPVHEQWYSRTAGGTMRLEAGNFSWMTRATATRLAMPQIDLFESSPPAAYDDPANSNSYDLVLSNLRYQKRLSTKLTGMARVYFGYSRRINERFVVGHDALVPGVPLGVLDPVQCPPGPEGPCRMDAVFLSRWLGVEAQSSYDWLGDGAYTTMVGVDGRQRTAAYEFVTFDDQTGLSYGSDPAYTRWHAGGNDQANEQALGAYLQQTLRPFPVLALNAGVRVDWDSRLHDGFTTDAISPRVALMATPTDSVSAKLIYSSAFRAPSFLEQNIVHGRLLPNVGGLEPETVSSYEASSTVRLGGLHSLTLNAFYARWHNLIELRIVNAQAPAVSRFENVSEVRNYGGGFAYDGGVLEGKLRFGVNGMLTAAERLLSAEQIARNARFGVGKTVPMTVAPHVYGNGRVAYSFVKDTTVAFVAGYLGRRIADQAYYAGEPSNLVPRPEAPPQLACRLVLTGSAPKLAQVGYSLGVDYAFASRQPFVVGPNQGLPRYLGLPGSQPELALQNRLTVFAGLTIDLDRASEVRQQPESGGGNTL